LTVAFYTKTVLFVLLSSLILVIHVVPLNVLCLSGAMTVRPRLFKSLIFIPKQYYLCMLMSCLIKHVQ